MMTRLMSIIFMSKSDYGKLILGAENGVGHLMQVRAPGFVPGLKMFDNSLTDEALEDAYDLASGRPPSRLPMRICRPSWSIFPATPIK